MSGADPGPLPGDLDTLLSAPGAELLASLRGQAVTPGTALALGTRLRERYPAALVAAALAQHELRLAARAKFSRAMDMFFTRAGLEQASAEVVARHRQARFAAAGVLADLCCGIGGDLVALAGEHQVRAVDRDPLHLRMAMLNAAAYGVSGSVRAARADVREADLAGVDAVFIDPARRTAGSTGDGRGRSAGQRLRALAPANRRSTGAWTWPGASPRWVSRRRRGSRGTRCRGAGNWSSSRSGGT